jgi:hypothetical protein
MAKGETKNGTISLADAQAQMAEAQATLEAARQSGLQSLNDRLSELDEERATVLAQIKELGGSTRRARKSSGGGSRSPRASNEITLINAVATVLSKAKKPLSATEVQAAVTKSGYESSAPNFPTMIAQNLSSLTKLRMGQSAVVVRPERGQYEAGSGMARYLKNPENATVAD